MEGEAFSDATIADYMNANFLPIKVDREERPDLDSIYMQAVQMLIGQGGWPLNVFLSPDDLVPFYGGTYFPIEPRYGRPGFLQVLQAIRQYYDTQKGKLQSVKDEILSNLRSMATFQPTQEIDHDLLKRGLEANVGVLAGKTPGPSFPMIPYAEVALRANHFSFESRYDAAEISRQRGMALALGGIFDHVAGGFHRYTVDPTWTVPHFEKMLYDNGQIVEYLANEWAAGVEEPAFERAIALTVEWLKREMTAPEGYFYAAQDADSFAHPSEAEPEEGAFYVWDYGELEKLLTPAELTQLTEQFTVTEKGNFEGYNVLQRHHSGRLAAPLEAALGKLFKVRYGAPADALPTFPPARNNQEAKSTSWGGRIPPVTDTKMIVAWNSLMISGLARAASVFNHSEYLELAVRAASFILHHQWIAGRFHRVNYDGNPDVLAQSEDYALFIKALLDVQQASLGARSQEPEARSQKSEFTQNLELKTQNPSPIPHTPHPTPSLWLDEAVKVQAEFDEFLWSLELGGYYNTDASSDLLLRERSYVDNATPAANGIAIANLVRLAFLTEDLSYLEKAEQSLQSFGEVMVRSPQACPSLFSALDWFHNHTLIRTSADRISTLISQFLPTAIYQLELNLPPDAVGLVCQGLSCNEPALTQEQLWEQIKQSQART
ncbi:thioredoxin domain-containing protein [Kovacikia minuta]|uniref:thioredoxin domain-containing protein n=1 Tax=Kovacikia minuta TaxID=2931930 RepID=UPI0036F2227B